MVRFLVVLPLAILACAVMAGREERVESSRVKPATPFDRRGTFHRKPSGDDDCRRRGPRRSHNCKHRGQKKYDLFCTEDAFKEYQKDHEKTPDSRRDLARRQRLCKRIEEFRKHNKDEKHRHYTKEVNLFTDMTPEEIKAYKGTDISKRKRSCKNATIPDNGAVVEDSLDWRAKGFVTPVKSQGQCGSCWAFSVVGAMESHLAIKKNKNTENLTLLSEQQLVDCAGGVFGNNGCNGGWPMNAYRYVVSNKGIEAEGTYPYTAKQAATCAFDADEVASNLVQGVSVPYGNETALKHAVASFGPVSVAIDANGNFTSYGTGVFKDPTCSQTVPNHAVLVVGYGTDPIEGDYWIVKNSWDTWWGENGYIRMARGVNQCGIANYGSYPEILL